MAKLYKTNGEIITVYPKNRKWSLEELQAQVGGYIQIVPSTGTLRMIANEEGRLKNLPKNERASELWKALLGNNPLRYEPVLVGDVLLLDRGERM